MKTVREFLQLVDDYPWTCIWIVIGVISIIEAIRGGSRE